MNEINTALIAVLGVLGGAYINNFAAEDFRRFRDSQALAGALAGELASIRVSFPDLLTALNNMRAQVQAREPLDLQEFPQASSPIFEANAGKIGLLSAVLAREVAFVYERVQAFRVLFHHLSKHHKDMKDEQRIALVQSCIQLVDGGKEKIEALVDSLDDHTHKAWNPPKLARLGIWVVIGVVVMGAVRVSISIVPAFYTWVYPWIARVFT